MKKSLKLVALGLLGAMAFTNTSHVKANEVPVDEAVKGLFETYYADGVYRKDTSIYMTEDAVLESIEYINIKKRQLSYKEC